ncbi:MAG: aminodeoxychorismate/anthranilate synthase component II [Candidatus Cloacimonetes bacterium]|nr:aminodeoxychorismate/anthranilate synthase component II [Candidatus Cloacimonadota bacterium]
MILIIDNYDSFTYNLVQYFGELGAIIKVIRNDEYTVDQIIDMKPEKIVISPGPKTPKDAGVSIEIIKRMSHDTPILGICLGHQSIGAAFGGDVVSAKEIVHGKVYPIQHDSSILFDGIKSPLLVTRYHSLIIDKSTLPECLEVTAQLESGMIMAVQHKKLLVFGLQFHPESIASEYGKEILNNFLKVKTTRGSI